MEEHSVQQRKVSHTAARELSVASTSPSAVPASSSAPPASSAASPPLSSLSPFSCNDQEESKDEVQGEVSSASSALARYTALPSPVAIPPNVIGLTYLHSFLSASECEELIATSAGHLERSVVRSGSGPSYVSADRTCYSKCLYDAEEDGDRQLGALTASLLRRVAELTGVSSAHVEAMQLIRYQPGQFYKPHCDDYAEDTVVGERRPRRWSIFTYLNDVTGGGGETHFTQIGVKFKPERGDALWWENCPAPFKLGVYHESSEHEGCPPLSGVKYGE